MNQKEEPNKFIRLSLRIIFFASLGLLLLTTLTALYESPQSTSPEIPATDSSLDDRLIIPGLRIGAVTLGLNMDRLQEIQGPAQKRPGQDGTFFLYEEKGLGVYIENSQVVSVTVRSPLYKAKNGLSVGRDVHFVLDALEENYELDGTEPKYTLHAWSSGWHFGIENGHVAYIQVTSPLDASSANTPK